MCAFCHINRAIKENRVKENRCDFGLSGGRCGDMRVRCDWGFDGAHADRFFGAAETEARGARCTTTTTTTSRIPGLFK